MNKSHNDTDHLSYRILTFLTETLLSCHCKIMQIYNSGSEFTEAILLVITINVIFRFSISSRSTRAIFKFRKLRSLLEIAQNILIAHHFDRWGWGLVLIGECLELNLYRQQWEAACNFALCNSTWQSSHKFPYKLHWIVTRAKFSQISRRSSTLMTCISASGSDIQKSFDLTLE